MAKIKVTKEQYKQVVDEILGCREAITKAFDPYTCNAIDRLIIARIKIEQIEVNRKTSFVPKESTENKQP